MQNKENLRLLCYVVDSSGDQCSLDESSYGIAMWLQSGDTSHHYDICLWELLLQGRGHPTIITNVHPTR